ncbi:hypothetical protein CK203_040475 [Vitis vinifera]|uniref:Uncharacterized protein n=1 Tax=Vitis vinifera TaxID=29760 RepID=A0A438I858_VITVI|nr:hypothetical protein CK203_040475 [Vitis vinifera]
MIRFNGLLMMSRAADHPHRCDPNTSPDHSIGRSNGAGIMVEIDWCTLKLYDLSKVRVRVEMKEHTVLPGLMEVKDGAWMFIISIVVIKDEDEGGLERNGSQCGTCGKYQRSNALQRARRESHNGTHGKRRVLVKDNYDPLSLVSNGGGPLSKGRAIV